MIEVKNTPGPWNQSSKGDGRIYIEGGAAADDIAVTLMVHDQREDAANARLIAAAPDLLAACEALLRFAESVRPGGGVLAGEHDMLRDARAAISKAGGAA